MENGITRPVNHSEDQSSVTAECKSVNSFKTNVDKWLRSHGNPNYDRWLISHE